MKLWDLETQHCTQTLVGHRKEVWSFTVDKEELRVYTGTADNFFRVYEIVYPILGTASKIPEIKFLGNIPREGKERVSINNNQLLIILIIYLLIFINYFFFLRLFK